MPPPPPGELAQQPRRRQHSLPHRHDARPSPACRSPSISSLPRSGQRDDAAFARARDGVGRLGDELRLQSELRLHRHHRQPGPCPAADGGVAGGGVRAAVRRQRHDRGGRRARMQEKGSILDSLLGEVAGLQRKVGAADRSRLSATSSLRDVERRISARSNTPARSPSPTGRPECRRASSSTPS